MKLKPQDTETQPARLRLTHGQTIKMSRNYQTVEVTQQVTLECDDSPAALAKTQQRAEEMVEEVLARKVKQQEELLEALGRKHR